jgi:hypothetical protein
MDNRVTKPEEVGLPVITFLYTLDQVASMLQMNVETFINKYVYLHMRSGPFLRHQIRASNIAPEGEKPDWRIAQNEWLPCHRAAKGDLSRR